MCRMAAGELFLGSFDLHDILGFGGPDEGRGSFGVVRQILFQGGHEFWHTKKDAAAQSFGGQIRVGQ